MKSNLAEKTYRNVDNVPTGLDTSNMREYKKLYARKWRLRKLQKEFPYLKITENGVEK